jgi:hypothetical protein
MRPSRNRRGVQEARDPARALKQNPFGGSKDKLGNIGKQGDRYLRSLFTAGALAVIRYAKLHGIKHQPWLAALLARRPTNLLADSFGEQDARPSHYFATSCYSELSQASRSGSRFQ